MPQRVSWAAAWERALPALGWLLYLLVLAAFLCGHRLSAGAGGCRGLGAASEEPRHPQTQGLERMPVANVEGRASDTGVAVWALGPAPTGRPPVLGGQDRAAAPSRAACNTRRL